ncbi:MAG: translocation/assembly module TamB domain-containing protein, partial [Chitinophagaceae bacterium]|nr:translocation/assembly module TamB domain-containing protein [Chitinophagaceae bacterium]
RTQYKQRVPVDVYLIVKNNLTKPEISFRLDMPERERNAFNGVIYNRIKQINEVESELNKQVMGLLVLNSFIPENPLALVNGRGGGTGVVEGTARKSASKLISQQLNNFAGNLIKGFDVNFDLESQDDFSTGKLQNSTNLNVGVSKSLFNDRVSVSVGSSINVEGPQQTQQASTLIGDVSVDYKITPNGRYRVRGYRQNETDAIVEGQIIETGASFIYVIDYNEFRELFHSKKKTPKEQNNSTKGK